MPGFKALPDMYDEVFDIVVGKPDEDDEQSAEKEIFEGSRAVELLDNFFAEETEELVEDASENICRSLSEAKARKILISYKKICEN